MRTMRPILTSYYIRILMMIMFRDIKDMTIGRIGRFRLNPCEQWDACR